METRDPIQRLREELSRKPLFSERNGYKPLDREPLLELLDEIETRYMRLPVDADGVPIRPGDEMQFGTDATVRVDSIGTSRCYCGDFGWFGSNGGFYGRGTLRSCRHVKPDTVESLLEKFADMPERIDRIAAVSRYAEHIRKACNEGRMD